MNKSVTVIDSMMGTGKTSYAIQLMREAEIDQRFIFVTPFLDEVQRIKREINNREFKEPEVTHGSGTKLQSLKRLIDQGENIATTHSLFAMADEELYELLRYEKYTLIMDEVMDLISVFQELRKHDIPVLLDSGLVGISDENQVIWKADPKTDTKYNTVRDYALGGNFYAVNQTAFVWNFPAKIFDMFEQVYIMTYMFDGQLQRYYYDLHSIHYEYYAVAKKGDEYALLPKSDVQEDHTCLKELIHIYEGKFNEVGKNKQALSKSWFLNSKNNDKIKKLKNNLYNYFRNVHKASADRILWTTFKDYYDKLKGKGFSKKEPVNNIDNDVGKGCFTSFNLRATNKYRHKDVLAFCLNRFMNPIEKHFFDQQNVKINEDLLALSDLLQWIFRSAVRDGKPVHIYVPSRRMRELLMKWLDNEI